MSPDNLLDELKPFVGLKPPKCEYSVVKESPQYGLELVGEFPLHGVIPRLNRLLLYRMMTLLYGKADILGGYISISDDEEMSLMPLFGLDWGFLLKLSSNLFSEVRTRILIQEYVLRIWAPAKPMLAEEQGRIKEIVSQFVKDLNETIDANLHLFDEDTEVKRAQKHLPHI